MANPTVVPYTFVSAPTIPTVAEYNTLTTDLTAVLAPEVCAGAVSGQSIATSTWTAVQLVQGARPTGDGVSGTIASYIYTANWGGQYDIYFNVGWTANTTGRRTACLKNVSGGVTSWIFDVTINPTTAGPTYYPDGTTTFQDVCCSGGNINLLAGDTLELYVWQSDGSANVESAQFSAVWLDN